jgi:hypothetical protein
MTSETYRLEALWSALLCQTIFLISKNVYLLEQNCISESSWVIKGGQTWTENVREWKILINPSIYEYNIKHRTVSFDY